MKNPLLILGGVLVCSVALPILISVVSYKDVNINTT